MNFRFSFAAMHMLLMVSFVNAQDTLQPKDSVHMEKTTLLIRRMDSIKVADSLRRASLLTEIENLKGTEANRQRQELLKRLKEEEAEDSIRAARFADQLTKLKATAKGFPVLPFGDTLFLIYTKVGSFSAAERAKAISDKIKNLYSDYEFKPDSLAVNRAATNSEIVYQDLVVMSISEMDALWFDKSQDQLALEYRNIISQAIASERKSNSIINIALRVGAIILILGGIYIIIRLINRGFKKINQKMISLKESILTGIKFRGYQFLDTDRELQVILFATNVVRLLIIVLALYITLPLLFSVFPWTRGIAETLIGWVLSPLKKVGSSFINYLPNLFTIIVIGGVTHYTIKFLKFIAGEIANESLTIPGFYPDWAKPTLNIVKFLVYAFSFIIIFPYLPGSDSPIFQGVSVFVGILFSLGSSSAISNAVAGLVITYMRPFKIGDRIKIGELTGDVVEKSLLVTRIRTIKNEEITIPNASVLSGHTVNYTTSAKELGLILHTGVTIGYDVPWKQVHELLIAAACATDGILTKEDKKPFVLQTSLDDFYVAYQINAYTNHSHRMAAIYSQLHQNIQDKFNEAGVEILSPHYRAARDGNMTTVPASYLPKEYQAPSFSIKINNDKEK
ncbi:MAG: mechanosensitive ion channel family protein [Cyclobacteriaceae bacterium]|nr:mechanosensitive ion channel family protein [Cyclobacteriaceae bacterium]